MSSQECVRPSDPALTPTEIVRELDRYIVAQQSAKRAVAIALRNRWRRLQVAEELRADITPKNILMIGPTGVGKTEISRRLAKLANAPFIKVEASKFTEVGYVGRDVESIIRDLLDIGIISTRADELAIVKERADTLVEDRLIDLIIEAIPVTLSAEELAVIEKDFVPHPDFPLENVESDRDLEPEAGSELEGLSRSDLVERLRKGELDNFIIEFETFRQLQTQMQIVGPHGLGEIEGQIKDMFAQMVPKQREARSLPVAEARRVLMEDMEDSLLDQQVIVQKAITRVEQSGIVFIDEVDKICTAQESLKSTDISREGVQRDLLPLVEGTTVSTKYGPVRTDHILFIASGAFHLAKPSDLMPEFQGRFPIRVELESLSAEHFFRILTEPKNALILQYKALLAVEGVDLEFTPEALQTLAKLTEEVNTRTENIGARRLHTLLERILDSLAFTASERCGEQVVIDEAEIRETLGAIVKNDDLSRYIL